ncbi:MAG: tetratricopeptide repeat protein [Nitrospirota bacterium]
MKQSFPKIILLIIPVIVIILYSNTIDVPFYFDDYAIIVDNIFIKITTLSPDGFMKGIFNNDSVRRLVTNITFAINYYFGGLDVSGYHIVNIIIHIITTISLYLFLKITLEIRGQRIKEFRVSSFEFRDKPFWIAIIAALLWSTSPVQTQAVTYIVQRATSMATMFYILSLLCYVKGRVSWNRSQKSKVRNKGKSDGLLTSNFWLLTSLFFALLAFGSKEITITLPLIIILYEIYFFARFDLKKIKKACPYFIIMVISFIVIGFIYIGAGSQKGIIKGIKGLMAARSIEQEFTALQRLITEFRVVIYYITLLLLPLPSRLRLIYEFSVSHSLFNPVSTFICMLIIFGIIGYGIYIYKRRTVISFFILWFFLNLVIESTVIRLWLVFEHRLYLPSIGFFIIAAIGIVKLADMIKFRYRSSPHNYLLFTAYCSFPIILILTQSVWTVQRNNLWKDPILFWSDNLKKTPDSSTVHSDLGLNYARNGNIDMAIEEYKKAIELLPKFYFAHYNLGMAYFNKGDIDSALNKYRDTLRVAPGFYEAHYRIGLIYQRQGNMDKAIDEYKKALSINPYHFLSRDALTSIYLDQKKWDMAIDEYKRVIEIFPNAPLVYNTLGILYKRTGRIDLSIDAYKKALRLDPDIADAHYNLGLIYFEQGNLDMALKEFKDSIRNDSARTIAYYNMGVIYYKQGRSELAIKEYKEALKRKPNYPEALYNLAYTLDSADKLDEAIIYYEKFLKLADKDERYKEFAEKARKRLNNM